MSTTPHPPHRLEGPKRPQLDHLERAHGMSRADLPRDPDALQLTHTEAHGRMAAQAPDPAETVAGLTGRAEQAFRTALEALERLVSLDRPLAVDLATRWVAAVRALTGTAA